MGNQRREQKRMRQHSGRKKDLMVWWSGVFFAITLISSFLGSAGEKVVLNKKLDGMPQRRGYIRGKTVEAYDEQCGKHQPCTLHGHNS